MKSILLLFAFLLSITLSAQQSAVRRVLIFAPDTSNALYLTQNKIFRNSVAGCEERDIVVENYILNTTNKRRFQNYQVSLKDFTLILIGKDGFAKFRSKDVVTAERLFAIIDAMPMRKDEIRKARVMQKGY